MPLSDETLAALNGPPHSYVIDRELYEISPDEWWPALRAIRPDGPWAFAFLLGITHPDDGEVLAERLIDDKDPLTQDDLVPIAERLVEKATGRPWYVAARLAVLVDVNWGTIDGRLFARGVDLLPLLRSQPCRALNIVNGLLYENADEKRRHELDAELLKPPLAARRQRRSVKEDAAAFEAAMAAGSGF